MITKRDGCASLGGDTLGSRVRMDSHALPMILSFIARVSIK